MTLLAFNINGKTPREKERLESSVSWDETALINNVRILVGILFRPIGFEGLRNNIIFLTSISSVGLRKKIIHINWGEKIMKIIFRVSNRRLNVRATLTKYLFNAFAISCGSVKLRPLSKILDGATLGNSFKEIRFFVPFHVFFK